MLYVTSALGARMVAHDIIVVGGSAGGGQALGTLLPLLPAELRVAVFIVLHRLALSRVYGAIDPLQEVLNRKTKLKAVAACDGQSFEVGHIYVVPPGCHLLLEHGLMRVIQSPAQNFPRTSVDTLFRSAASTYRNRVVGVLLSGMLSDGTAGFWEIRKHGGITIAQDPAEAPYPSMPASAMKEVPVHYCLPISEIATKLIQLANEPAATPTQFKPRILIVEDERIIALNLEKRLTDLGYSVVASVSSGEAALNTVARASPDIVLMDIHLSGKMRGTEAAKILWEQFGIPIVYLTAYADEESINDAKLSMPYAYIVKPYLPAQIHTAIQLALDRRERELPWGQTTRTSE